MNKVSLETVLKVKQTGYNTDITYYDNNGESRSINTRDLLDTIIWQHEQLQKLMNKLLETL